MSIQLVKNNYEIVVASFVDYIYIKVTNLINYSSYENKIHIYDITSDCVKTIKNLWNIFERLFTIIKDLDIDILNPNFDNIEDYIVLKLLEHQNNVVLTIYYNIALSFEFTTTLNKIKCESSICDLNKVKCDMDRKDIQIKDLHSKVTQLQTEITNIHKICSNLDCVIGINSAFSIVSCKLNVKTLKVDINSNFHLATDFSSLYNLKKLEICFYIPCKNKPIISNTLESLIIEISYCYQHNNQNDWFSFDTNTIQLPNLKYLEIRNAPNIPTLLNYLEQHPNKFNIELVFIPSTGVVHDIEKYRSIGLKKITVK